ncbi:MAG: flagellar basal body L-ring protein FlgH [Gallionella sp.]|nr:flagellar basal body L-ring protein FlgH [Gallionella sp.]MDD4945735.1 flagellar basal body L-ring protein FlgH [Gallionella sp.]MDD5613148.1 flagellar basal body L-ring protein FlgH [Gallionella sp.]
MSKASVIGGKWAMWAICLLLAACTSGPPTHIHQPMTAKPVANKAVAPADGAIYHAGINEHPLFEDRRARNVGDILTINIVEKTTGNRKSSNSANNSSNIAAATPNATVGPLAKLLLKAFNITSSSANKSAAAGAGAASEDLTGTISVTVIEVLANGNLLVSGEKQVSLNSSDEYIRFSGVVNPTSINNLNTVQSTQVADAHIEYKSAGEMNQVMNDAQSLGFLGRFFLSVLPF